MAASSPPSSDEQFAIGSVLDGRYRIDGVLGTGGMGRVYRAEHTKIGRSVAIKVLHAAMGRNREASQRFQREAIASGRLDHPNIVGVSDFGVLDDGACYLVMEILEGESLGDRLARDTRIHWSEAIDILRGVLYGLRHAHERGVVHRDIKPDNVYLAHKDGDPVIKILDFGIAKLYAGSDDDPASTRAGLTVGTPAYLSPEQAVGGAITPASDLYSASIVLYEMLAGRAPFEDRDPLAMLGAHVSRRPPRFAVIAPGVDIPPPLETIVQRGLVKTAADRISTAADYLAILETFSPSPRTTGEWLSSSAQRLDRQATERSDSTEIDPPSPEAQGQAHAAPDRRSQASGGGDGSAGGAGVLPRGIDRAPVVAVSLTPVAATQATRAALGTTPDARPAAATAVSANPLPRAAHPVSLAETSEPIPLTWIVRSSVLVGAMIVFAIVLSLVARCTASEPPAKAATPMQRDKPAARATK